MAWTLAFWTGLVALGFAFFLALQMRIFAGLSLRWALIAERPELSALQTRQAVHLAAHGRLPANAEPWLAESVSHLQADYPSALKQLRLARLVSLLTPFAIALILLARRLLAGGI